MPRMTSWWGGSGERRHAKGDEGADRRAVVNRQSPIPTIRSRRGFLAALSAGAASEHLSTNLIVQLATKDLAPFAVRGLFAPRRPWLTEPDTGTSAIFVDKLNPSRLKRFLQHFTRVIGYVRPECTFDALKWLGEKARLATRGRFETILEAHAQHGVVRS
jgi:hypothetical protein